MDAVVAAGEPGKVFAGGVAAREIHDVLAAATVDTRSADAVFATAREQADAVLAWQRCRIVRLCITYVVSRKRTAVDDLPIVSHRVPETPAAIFVDDRMHCADRAASWCAIENRRFLHALEVFATVPGNRKARERQKLGLGHALEADIEHVQSGGRIHDVTQDHPVIVKATIPAYVEHGVGADSNDCGGIVGTYVHIADAAYAVGIAKPRVDAYRLIVESIGCWRK